MCLSHFFFKYIVLYIMPIPIGNPRPLKPLPYQPHPIVMRPVFIDTHTGEIIDRTPQAPEKEKPFSDILKKK